MGRAMTIAALLWISAACAAREYAAEPVEATVVDAQTKKPIAGALVIARWVARGGGGMHAARDLGSVEVMEAVTGADGRFRFPAWGPRPYEGRGVLLDDDPLILVFKRGYEVARLGNSQYRVPPSKDFRSRKTGPTRFSLWNGETAEMTPFTRGDKAFAATVYNAFVASDVWNMFAESTPCDWKRLPRTVEYLEDEKRAYVAQGADPYGTVSIRDRLVMNDESFARKGCGSPRAHLKEAAP